jgi:hypothetical protein
MAGRPDTWCDIVRGRTVLALVRRAWRRLLFNELLRQGANSASAAFAAIILLLLLGAQILDWRVAILIPVTAAAIGLYRVRRRLPDSYLVAQIIDRRLNLADTLSTALFFTNGVHQHADPEIRRLQYERAERVAETVDARQAVPYQMPRSIYSTAALALVATSLFALRYGLTRSLDLKAPLSAIVQQSLGFEAPAQQAHNSKLKDPDPIYHENDSAEQQQAADARGGNRDSDAAAQEEGKDAQAEQGEQKKGASDGKKQGQEGEQAESGEQQSSDEDRAGQNSDSPGESQQGMAKSDQKQNGKQDSNSADNSSVLSKLKDAVQNLMSRVKPQQAQQGSHQQTANDRSNSSSQKQNGGKPQSGKDGQASEQSDSQEGEPGEQGRNGQDADGKAAGKQESQQAGKQPGSGIGSRDGDKSVKQAADLAAMGKITELLGKRSQNITGEATVEVQNTSQQLRTPYADRGLQHSQNGGEIRRDEVPVALQAYVEHYFEQVRKQATPAKQATTQKKQ